jgi:SSS family solute:Na+ symporter
MTLAILGAYLTLVLMVGLFGHRLFRGTGEDFFLASRSIGPFVLLMTLFGTHMTAFSLLGASGEAYHKGIGVFSLMASSSALVAPIVFLLIGTKLWKIGKAHGFLTQVQFFRERWGSDRLAWLLFVLLVLFLVPYLLIGVMGGGLTFEEITGGQVPRWLGSFLICFVVAVYVTAGGVRSTAWANTLQTLVFMCLGALTFVVIVRNLGGLEKGLSSVDTNLLMHGDRIPLPMLISYTLIPLSVGMFPHIFMHWLTARSESSFRLPIVAYPLCVATVWLPSVLLGILGTAEVPDLAGPAANSVLLRMISLRAPEVLVGLLGAGVFAAVMSSLDSQILALSTLFTQDIARRSRLGKRIDESRQVLVGRVFVLLILALTYGLSLISNRSIFRLGIWSFTGFAALFPLVVAALYWRRSSKYGAGAAAVTVAVLWLYYFLVGWQSPSYTVGGSGWMPVSVLVVASSLAMIFGSLLGPSPEAERVLRFFPTDKRSA